jgi:hypothetical protein
MKRVFGFEILPAPFVVSHLQIGLLLQHFGVPLGDKKKERMGVQFLKVHPFFDPIRADPRFTDPVRRGGLE